MAEVRVADRLLVPFEGEGGGVGELSWGQQEMWRAIQRVGSSLALGGASPLSAGMSLDAAAAVLSFIMSRHQSLRTRVRFGADGRARQAVAVAGEAPLEVVDVGAADPAEVAEAVYDRFHAVEFDYANEWPVRMAVLRQGGVLSHVVAMYCHLAIDGAGLAALVADLSTMDFSTGRSSRPVRGLPPLEQARWQSSPAGQRRSESCLRHWERLLRSIPTHRAPLADPARTTFREFGYESPATDLAARVVAARVGVDTSPVLLAAFAVALARVTGRNPSAAQVVVSNRFWPGLAESVSTISHPGLCAVDVAGISFDEAVTRARLSSLSAYKNAYCDPVRRAELIARIGAERGADVDIDCFFNDRRAPARRQASDPVPTPAQIRAALPASRLRRLSVPVDPGGERFFMHVNDVAGTIDMRVSADTGYLPPASLEAFLHEFEAVTVRAALDPATRTGVAG
jgi:hypothetical protein